MHNLVYCIGRLVDTPELKEENGKEKVNLVLAVQRPVKNEEGCYDTDFIDLRLDGAITKHTTEYCSKGDLVGVKGRIETNNIYNEDGSVAKKLVEVVVDKISFLANANKVKENDNVEINEDYED